MAEEAEGENKGWKIKLIIFFKGWKIKLIIFLGGTYGSVHTQTFNNNLKELGVVETKRNSIRKGLVHELLNAQDTGLCSYFAQRSGERVQAGVELETWKKLFKGWTASFERERVLFIGTQCSDLYTSKVGVRRRGGQRKGGRQAGDAGAQIGIGIEAERRF